MESTNNATFSAPQRLSVKYVLELIPRFTGSNIPLSQFRGLQWGEKCVASALWRGAGAPHARPLTRRSVKHSKEENFTTVQALVDFLEGIFREPQSYYEYTGKLANLKQKTRETTISFYKRLRDIKQAVATSAQRENRINYQATFNNTLETDCLKQLLCGLCWEIRARLTNPTTLEAVRNKAISESWAGVWRTTRSRLGTRRAQKRISKHNA